MTPCAGYNPLVPVSEIVWTGAPLLVMAKTVPRFDGPPTDDVVQRFPSEACRKVPITNLVDGSVICVTC